MTGNGRSEQGIAVRAQPDGSAELLDALGDYLPEDRVEAAREAYAYAAECHEGQLRKSGDPYIVHPVSVARLVAGLNMDVHTVQAALLHDVIEDCGVSARELSQRFGAEVVSLVEGATKIEHLPSAGVALGARKSAEDAETLRKMLVAMAEDVRVVIVKIADRLHNMQTIQFLDPERQQAIARETMDIYAPLASRLGIWQMKWQLEDLAFRVLEPEHYRRVASTLASRRAERERFVRRVERGLREALEDAGIEADVIGRVKHLYSIHEKMQRYAAEGKSFDQIHDLLAVRVIVNSVAECYHALGVVHQTWHPIPNSFDDYIGNPKESMYQSLHTSVLGPGARPFEVQIRTREMHEVAEYGVAAHWAYKEHASARDRQYEERMAWLRHLIEWQQEASGTEDFLDSVKTDVFRDQVFVFTPRGDVRVLPAGSTPIDFAYRIHTDLGHHCTGARVNGRLVALSTKLRNGDVIEIVRGRRDGGPSRDWLNPELGYLGSSLARQKVRQWFRRQRRGENVAKGRELLERERKRMGIAEVPDDLHPRVPLRVLRGHARGDRLRRRLAAGARPKDRRSAARAARDRHACSLGAARAAERARARLRGAACHARAVLRAAAGRRYHRLHHALPRRHGAPARLSQHAQRRGAAAFRRVRLGPRGRALRRGRRGARLGSRRLAAGHQHARRRRAGEHGRRPHGAR